MIKLEDVWAAGMRAKFPANVLRLVMEAYSFARRLTFQKEVAEPVHTLLAILAGSGMAQVALAMVLAEQLERIVNARPQRPLVGAGCGRLRGTQFLLGMDFGAYIR